jgi:hypothetical protein
MAIRQGDRVRVTGYGHPREGEEGVWTGRITRPGTDQPMLVIRSGDETFCTYADEVESIEDEYD